MNAHDVFLVGHGECCAPRLEHISEAGIHFVMNDMGLGRTVEFQWLTEVPVATLWIDVLSHNESRNFARDVHFQTDRAVRTLCIRATWGMGERKTRRA